MPGRCPSKPELTFDLTAKKISCPSAAKKTIQLQKLSDIVDYDKLLEQKTKKFKKDVGKMVDYMISFSRKEKVPEEKKSIGKITIKDIIVGQSDDKITNLVINDKKVCKGNGEVIIVNHESVLYCEMIVKIVPGDTFIILTSEFGRKIELGIGSIIEKPNNEFEIFIH